MTRGTIRGVYIQYSFLHCLHRVKGLEDPAMTHLIRSCAGDCARQHEIRLTYIQTCLLECYEELIEKPTKHNEKYSPKTTNKLGKRMNHFLKDFRHKLDVVYTQNPSLPALDLVNSSLLLSLSKIFTLFLR